MSGSDDDDYDSGSPGNPLDYIRIRKSSIRINIFTKNQRLSNNLHMVYEVPETPLACR